MLPSNSLSYVNRGDLVLEFDDGGLLRTVRRAGNGYVCLEHRAGGASPWRLGLRDRAGQSRTVTALDACACHVESVGAGLRLTWSEIGNASDVVVYALLTPQQDGLACRLVPPICFAEQGQPV